MTTNWMTMRIRKITSADDQRAADDEVAERVDDLAGVAVAAGRGGSTRRSAPSRNSVATSSSDGKTEKSSGRLDEHRGQQDHAAPAGCCTTMSTSSSGAGSGTTSSSTMPTTPIGHGAAWLSAVLHGAVLPQAVGLACGDGALVLMRRRHRVAVAVHARAAPRALQRHDEREHPGDRACRGRRGSPGRPRRRRAARGPAGCPGPSGTPSARRSRGSGRRRARRPWRRPRGAALPGSYLQRDRDVGRVDQHDVGVGDGGHHPVAAHRQLARPALAP